MQRTAPTLPLSICILFLCIRAAASARSRCTEQADWWSEGRGRLAWLHYVLLKRALCCCRDSESPNSVNHCWRGTKGSEGWGAWLHCQREAGPYVCLCVCCVPARAAWQDGWHLTWLLPSFLSIQAAWLPLWSKISSLLFTLEPRASRLRPLKGHGLRPSILLRFVVPNEVTRYVLVLAKHFTHHPSANLMAFHLFKGKAAGGEVTGWGARRRRNHVKKLWQT